MAHVPEASFLRKNANTLLPFILQGLEFCVLRKDIKLSLDIDTYVSERMALHTTHRRGIFGIKLAYLQISHRSVEAGHLTVI